MAETSTSIWLSWPSLVKSVVLDRRRRDRTKAKPGDGEPNQNLEAMFISLFSIGAPASIHLGVVSEIIEANQPFKSSRD
ncbi:hypothetical protein H5410_004984 [Solanum commersonii]|uniref:Uncharacterized protein n=1 Tax=Solanum commersonii TaxID=4109 RepID=A0A9J6A570_SOLCO|nr:hypothetical protein H5410_004984 [Solanum commersonii]